LPVSDQAVALKAVASGTILARTAAPDERYFLDDIQTGVEYKVPAAESLLWAGAPQISPNGNTLALMELEYNPQTDKITNDILWVIDAQGKILAKISFNRVNLGAVRWLNDKRLIIETNEYGTLLALNPFTQDQQGISNELPDLYTYSGPGGPWWRVEYSPDLECVVYFYMRNQQNGASQGIIVRDVIKKQNLWLSSDGDGGRPVWSPTGQEVAVVDYREGQLYLINRSGKAEPILKRKLANQVNSPSWSPDGYHIAFWNADSLMVYDRQTGQVLDLCISDGGSPNPASPLWSPNSHQIIVNEGLTTGPILVDLQTNAAYHLQTIPNSIILAWMNSQP
jgi:Tol biopolymer transport system component